MLLLKRANYVLNYILYLQVEQAILSDATYFFMKRFYELALVTRGHKTKSLYCNEQDISENGFRLYTYMVAVSKSEFNVTYLALRTICFLSCNYLNS